MNENQPPFEIQPNEHLEARITAYVLGEASAFEAAEIQTLCDENPELKIFLNRTQTLHKLLKETETSEADHSWKLPADKRQKLDSILGFNQPIASFQKESRIRRSAYRAAFGIAAIFILTLVVSRFIFIEQKSVYRETPTMISYMASEEVEESGNALNNLSRKEGLIFHGDRSIQSGLDEDTSAAFAIQAPASESLERSIDAQDYVGAKQEFQENAEQLNELTLTLNSSAVADSSVVADVSQYAKRSEASSSKPSPPADSMSRGIASNSALPTAIPVPEIAMEAPSTDFGEGQSFGGGWSSDEQPDGIDLDAGKKVQLGLSGTASADPNEARQAGAFRSDNVDAFAAAPAVDAFSDAPAVDAFAAAPAAATQAKSEFNPVADSEPAQAFGRARRELEITTEAKNETAPADSRIREELGFLDATIRTNPALSDVDTAKVDKIRRHLYTAQGDFDLGKLDDAKKGYEDTLRIDPQNSAARRGLEKIASAKNDYYRAANDHTRAELLMQVDEAWEFSVPAEGVMKPRIVPTKNTPIDLADFSQEIPATQEPFSTFSLNISDASFQIALAAIAKGERPDPASIKPEQFYNAVNYGDPAPLSHEPVAAAIDQTAHPVIPGRNLVRVGIRTASTGRSAAQPLRLTLLVDQSGSMVRSDRRAAMETALAQLATLLTENDQVTVIGFSRTPRLLADSLSGAKANQLSDLINQTANEGGTNLEEAIKLASEMALRHQLAGAQNRIVLFTDGAANLGNADPERLAKNIELIRQQGLAFDIAGIGTDDVNDQLLAELARHGNGRYYLVNETTGNSLATQLAGAFRPAAENVKVQVKLNPERVGNYKLIGFEKDRLKTEDFRNDAVDAAELAADEAGIAIYQVETLPEGSGEIGEVSVRFRDTASGEMVERSWTIPYEATTQTFDKAYPKTQLATLSLLAAQKLQGGPLADAIDFNHFAKTIAELRQNYQAEPKAQQMLNLINALK